MVEFGFDAYLRRSAAHCADGQSVRKANLRRGRIAIGTAAGSVLPGKSGGAGTALANTGHLANGVRSLGLSARWAAASRSFHLHGSVVLV